MARKAKSSVAETVATYGHPSASSRLRPEVGTQAQFKKKKAPKTFRYDSSLSPVRNAEAIYGIPATYVQATPDLLMGDLLKTLRPTQIFSVYGEPDVEVRRRKDGTYEAELKGLEVFDPVTMEVDHRSGNDVPAWLLDTDYNGLSFHVSQAFFPRTSAWDGLKRALRTTFEESVWDHLAGTVSAPFPLGENKSVAIKVIDDRGNELLAIRKVGRE